VTSASTSTRIIGDHRGKSFQEKEQERESKRARESEKTGSDRFDGWREIANQKANKIERAKATWRRGQATPPSDIQ